MPQNGYNHRREFSLICQKLALKKVYPAFFPREKYKVIEVDEIDDSLAEILDIGGIDKLFRARNGGYLISLSHRFRESAVWNAPHFRDFTIREAEWDRHKEALTNNGTIPNFYGYGYANDSRINAKKITDFHRFYLVDYKKWFADVLNCKTRAPYFKEIDHQENFYWIKWQAIPDNYIVYQYPSPIALTSSLPLFDWFTERDWINLRKSISPLLRGQQCAFVTGLLNSGKFKQVTGNTIIIEFPSQILKNRTDEVKSLILSAMRKQGNKMNIQFEVTAGGS